MTGFTPRTGRHGSGHTCQFELPIVTKSLNPRRHSLTRYPSHHAAIRASDVRSFSPDDLFASGATSGAGVLATFTYDDLGNRTSLARGNGTSSSYTYDPVSRLASLTHDLASTANDVTKTFGYNPASQMTSVTTSNDAYASNVPDRGTTGFTTNGLNELATIDGGAVSYDTNGNLIIDPWLNHSFSYNAEDQMTAASQLSATAGLAYDPLDRLDTYNPSSGAFRRFVYDGDEVSAELDSSGSIVNRYIRGDAPDEVLLDYTGSGSSSYRYYHLDERMSPIAWSDEGGAIATVMHYDEFGIPDPTNPGRFQYTGQMWLSEIGEYFYKTRGFSANMGRFLQTDPTGYSVGPNLYAYVGNDPVNFADPLGLGTEPGLEGQDHPDCIGGDVCTMPIIVNGIRLSAFQIGVFDIRDFFGPRFDVPTQFEFGRGGSGDSGPDIVVTAKRKTNLTQCALAVGGAALGSFANPLSVIGGIAGAGNAVYQAQNRTAPQDYGKPEYRGVFKRGLSQAISIGAKRFIPGYLQVSIGVAGVFAAKELLTNPSCGIEAF